MIDFFVLKHTAATTMTMKEVSLEPPLSNDRETVDKARALEFIAEWTPKVKGVLVTSVSFAGKAYKIEAAQVLADFLRPHVAHVKSVNVGDFIAGLPEDEALASLKCICDVFVDCELERVDVSENALGSKGIQACSSLLNAQTKSLKELYLANNGLAAETLQEIADILLQVDVETNTCACHQLEVLHVYNNMIGNEGAPEFERILRECRRLKTLVYSGNRALSAGSLSLARGLNAMDISHLETLNLEGSHFGNGEDENHGVHLLSQALTEASNLKRALFRDFGLQAEGLELVTQALIEAGAPLEEMDVSDNEAEPEGAVVVANLIRQVKNTLQVFSADFNQFTSIGIRTLAQALSESPKLRKVVLNENECGHIGAVALCEAELPQLETIFLDENAFLPDDVAMLEAHFGDKLQPMEENDASEDVDAELEEAGEEEVEELAEQLAESQV